MDAMRALAAGEGCTADGTAATRNPLSQFVNSAMGGMDQGKHMQRGPPQGFQGAGPQGQQGMDAIERGMSQGMGMMQRQAGPAAAMQQNAFMHEFEQMRAAGVPPGAMMGPRGPMARGPAMRHDSGWVEDFQRMSVGPQLGPQQRMDAAYKDSFRRPQMRAEGWANNMMARGQPRPTMMNRAWKNAAQPSRAGNWAQEMAAKPAVPVEARAKTDVAKSEQVVNQQEPDMDATRQAVGDLVDVMSQNEAFRDSQFYDFMNKVSTGELNFENNTVVQNLNMAPARSSMEAAFAETSSPLTDVQAQFAEAWQESFDGNDKTMNDLLQQVFRESEADGGLAQQQMEEAFARAQQQLGGEVASMQPNPADMPYEMIADNPYTGHGNPFEEGMELFREGQLKEAIMAFEAAVEQDPSHADAWRMLGVAHQENDEDKKAIICLERTVEQDAYHLDALLGLGVSYVNELDPTRALKNLKAWVVNNPNFQGLEVQQDAYSDGTLVDDVMQLMLKAAEWAPKDPDVQEVLGVLYNVSRDYNSAAQAFRHALTQKPDDYSLWNKLGAKLANGSQSEEAIPAYHRALELKPKYARGWLNLGISHSNLAGYEEAARCYLKALDLNPNAVHIWSYLRLCFTCMERFDLISLAQDHNLDAFRQHFEF